MIAVVGCGNLNRCDDGAGPTVVRLLRDRMGVSNEVSLIDAGTDGMAAMFSARGCRALIVIDACASGSEPGAVFELPGTEVERAYEPGLNLHDFRWDHALYAGRRIFGAAFPSDVTVILIEAKRLDLGLDLSGEVAAAVLEVADRVATLIEARLATAAAPA